MPHRPRHVRQDRLAKERVVERLASVREYDADGDDDEEDGIDEEPLSQIVERLDGTVFGLIEALIRSR